jgi:sugar phosphate isomerase/epimerase
VPGGDNLRLGANIFTESHDPEEIVAEYVRKGYRAAYTPDWLCADTEPEACRAFKAAFARHDVVLAETGIWRNVLSPDAATAKAAFEWSVRRLATAEELGAKCAVNIVGSWNADIWDGPDARHYSPEFFDAAVEAARKVIDAVRPARTKMTFEVMPCQFIDGAAEYMRFLKAVNRSAAGIHLDVTNSITCPRQLYDNARFLENELAIYGGAIVSVHAKDLRLNPRTYTVDLEETIIGRGDIDYPHILPLLNKLPPDTPIMLEHLETEAEYDESAKNLRAFAKTVHVIM